MLSDSQLYRLRYQHQTIMELVKDFTEEQLRWPVNSGKWSVLENIAHLAAYQPAFLERIARIQQEDQPIFERYVADNDPSFAPAVALPLAVLVDKLVIDRERIVQALEIMDAAQMSRTGIHPRFGKMNMTTWTEFFLLHEAHHLFTMFMLTAELRRMQNQN